MIHGTEGEIVMFDVVHDFTENNLIDSLTFTGWPVSSNKLLVEYLK